MAALGLIVDLDLTVALAAADSLVIVVFEAGAAILDAVILDTADFKDLTIKIKAPFNGAFFILAHR